LINIKGNTYIYDNIVCQGGYQIDGHWLIIDSGGNESNAKKSIKAIEYTSIDYVFNTHSHADHCGGNDYFQNKQNAKIIAPALEANFITSPILEPIYLYGAYPPKELQNRFLMAKPSRVDIEVSAQSLDIELGGQELSFETISLKGHSPNMMGLISPDNIAFIGDALIDKNNIDKHPLIFTYNVHEHLDSIDKLKTLKCEGYVLAHGGYYDSIDQLVGINRQALIRVSNDIKEIVNTEDITLEALHQTLASKYQLKENLSTYTLNHSVIKAHVQYLIDSAIIKVLIEDGMMILQAL
jgi:glyoxylase-like metal-dependent hydrolase (beta-lactamase superfamily II)